jgi:hypothetical protein
MNKSTGKTKLARARKPAKTGFAETAKKAMRKAQQVAAREDARFGLHLILAR